MPHPLRVTWQEQIASNISLGRVLAKAEIKPRLKSLRGGENQQRLSFIIYLSRIEPCSDEIVTRKYQKSTGFAYSRKRWWAALAKPLLVTWLSRSTLTLSSHRGIPTTALAKRFYRASPHSLAFQPCLQRRALETRVQGQNPNGRRILHRSDRLGQERRSASRRQPPVHGPNWLRSEPARVFGETRGFPSRLPASIATHACPTYTAPLTSPPRPAFPRTAVLVRTRRERHGAARQGLPNALLPKHGLISTVNFRQPGPRPRLAQARSWVSSPPPAPQRAPLPRQGPGKAAPGPCWGGRGSRGARSPRRGAGNLPGRATATSPPGRGFAPRRAGSRAVARQRLPGDGGGPAMAAAAADTVPAGTFPSFMAEGTLLCRRGEYDKALACFNNVRAPGGGGVRTAGGASRAPGRPGGRRCHPAEVGAAGRGGGTKGWGTWRNVAAAARRVAGRREGWWHEGRCPQRRPGVTVRRAGTGTGGGRRGSVRSCSSSLSRGSAQGGVAAPPAPKDRVVTAEGTRER